MRKNNKKILKTVSLIQAGLLTSLIILPNLVPLTINAEEIQQSTPKQEVVYINLESDGEASEINTVNIFNIAEGKKIIDYGNYSSVRNMNTTDEITLNSDAVNIDAKAGKLYYEGKLDNKAIPWNFDIRYYVDGKEYTAKEAAGKSGALKICMSVRKNDECDSTFFNGYALQISFTLDTEKAENIVAEGATTANVGAEKQLTFTVFPGKETDIKIAADVTSFEMKPVTINGIRLNMDIEINNSELTDKIKDLNNGISDINNGTKEIKDGISELKSNVDEKLKTGTNELADGSVRLKDGASALKDGGSDLQNGTDELKNGAESLDNGVGSLDSGIQKLKSGLEQLDSKSSEITGGSAEIKNALKKIHIAISGVSASADDIKKLTDASSEIKSGIDNLTDGISELKQKADFGAYKATMDANGLDIDKLKSGNDEAIKNLTSITEIMDSQINALKQISGSEGQISQLQRQVDQYNQIIILLSGSNASIAGTEAYLNALGGGAGHIYEGASKLKTNYENFDNSISIFAETLKGLLYKLSELNGAVDILVNEYGKLDTGINSYTDGVSNILSGYSQIADGSASLVSGSKQLCGGSTELFDGTSALVSGLTDFYDSAETLSDGMVTVDKSISGLSEGIKDLYTGSEKLNDGSGRLKNETSEMDSQVSEKIDEMIQSISGKNEKTVSFVSEKNTDTESVQFVIKTSAIEISEEPAEPQPEEKPMNFWEKLLHLFGL